MHWQGHQSWQLPPARNLARLLTSVLSHWPLAPVLVIEQSFIWPAPIAIVGSLNVVPGRPYYDGRVIQRPNVHSYRWPPSGQILEAPFLFETCLHRFWYF